MPYFDINDLRPLLRDAIAYGVLCADRTWNGETMGMNQAVTERRIDELVTEYLRQA